MSRILFICPDKTDPTAFYRASGITHDLAEQSGHIIHTIAWNEIAVSWQTLSNYDLLFLQRPFTKVAVDICAYAKDMNRPVWIDYDDNLWELNPENKAFHTYNDANTKEYVKECVKAADAVTVPTEYLRQIYGPYNKNTQVIPNAFNENIIKRPELKPREKKVLWRGPESHIYDLMTYAKEINQASAEFPEYEFIFMGYYPWFLSETDNKGYLPGLDIIMYHKRIFDLAPTLMHVPLHDNSFNRCRSNIAFIEGSYAGAVCVVPAWWNLPYAMTYQNGPEYYEAMRLVLSGEVDAVKMNAEAWEYIMDCLTLKKVNQKRADLIETLLEGLK